eukprot:6609195-Pyramimonas_sp.AAC.1
MCSERQLAQMRRACREGDVERVCSSGFIAQVLTEHKRLDRDDPCVKTRAQLLADRVPIRAAERESSWTRPSSGFVHFMATEQTKRKRELGPLRGDDYTTWKHAKIQEWHSLSDARKLEEAEKAELAHAQAQADVQD